MERFSSLSFLPLLIMRVTHLLWVWWASKENTGRRCTELKVKSSLLALNELLLFLDSGGQRCSHSCLL